MVCDYKNGKIYVIKSSETDGVYIGSTCATLKVRFCKHKSAFKGGKFRIGTIKDILKYADAYIELIENFPCESKKELLNREGEIIRNTPKCVNTQIQGRTMEQYREEHKDKLKEQSREYREKNKDMLNQKYADWYNSDKSNAYFQSLKAKRNIKIKCSICDKEYSKSNIARHEKTHK